MSPQELIKYAGENVNNAGALKMILSSLVTVCKLFFALNSQVDILSNYHGLRY